MSLGIRRKRRGFTLLEVLLVIGIIALIAAFVLPSIMGAGEEARIGLAQAAVEPNGPLGSALQKYKWNIGTYPETDEGLKALIERPSSVDESSGKWKGPYIVPADPEKLKDPWGNEYQYRFPGEITETEFDLWSFGPDLKDGTDDDITSWKKK